MRRALIWIVGGLLALAAAGAIAIRVPAVQDRVVAGAIDRMVRVQATHLFEDDALRVLLCGTSSPLPHATRAKPCVAVFAADRFWVVDTGLGSWNRLALWRVPGEKIGGVLLTHFHSDHIGELGEYDLQTWVAGREGPLQVFGPEGVVRVVRGFEDAYALDTGYRIAHHGSELLDEAKGRMQARTVRAPALGEDAALVLEEDGLKITMFRVEHAPIDPAVGYRFEYKGRSVVVSGDTKKSDAVVEASRGADVLVHEAQANHILASITGAAGRANRPRIVKVTTDILDYHTSPIEAAEVANEAGVDLVVFTHLTPPPPLRIVEDLYVRGVAEVRPDGWILADDGLLLTLPSGSDAIEVGSLD